MGMARRGLLDRFTLHARSRVGRGGHSRTLDPHALRKRSDRRGGARLHEQTRVEATRAGRKGRQRNATNPRNSDGVPSRCSGRYSHSSAPFFHS